MATRLIEKVLVANRGEIACRVFRTAKKMGISTVAVYSSADKNSLHTSLADHSFYIGEAAPTESYLNKQKIIDTIKKSYSQAVHPGYGFLSENADFADLCSKNGIIFVGPPASAIKAMGSKSESKKIMVKANVPVVPGYHEESQDIELLRAEAEKIGYPVLIKAVMGGGGKGMKLAQSSSEFLTQLESAKNESLKAFGDDRVILEKYIINPHHIEVQVFADTLGNAVYLFERDCSVQRRHQKIIEEAPSYISEEKRHSMGKTATQAALAVGYVGAGTVEFIYDEDTKEFYFMEMNTRLQVEHPVTEMITGLDLVEWQFVVASGHPLPLKQDQIKRCGHSFETRIYAEDPYNSFLPNSGKILHMSTPDTSKNLRIDTGIAQDDSISVYYDPLIAKLIVHGKDRTEALNMIHHALANFHICGLKTNIQFLKDLVTNDKFRNYDFNTNFIAKNEKSLLARPKPSSKDFALATVCLMIQESEDKNSPWHSLKDFRLNSQPSRRFLYEDFDSEIVVGRDKNYFDVKTKDFSTRAEGKHLGNNVYEIITQGSKEIVRLVKQGKSLWFINSDGALFVFGSKDLYVMADQNETQAVKKVSAPLPGRIIKINVKKGDEVKENSVLAVIESMKLHHMIYCPRNAKILDCYFSEGDSVNADDILLALE